MKCSIPNCYACTHKHVRVKHPEPKVEPSNRTPAEIKRLENEARWRVGYAMGRRTPKEVSELGILDNYKQKSRKQDKPND